MNKNTKRLELSRLYNSLLDIYLKRLLDKHHTYTELNKLLVQVIDDLRSLTDYMLRGRFEPVKRQRPVITGTKHISPDLVKYLLKTRGIKEEKVSSPLNLLDIIKFFKLLENFTLKRKYLDDSLKDYGLGDQFDVCNSLYCNLPKLFLGVDEVAEDDQKDYLNLIFSAITIYRQFKVKSIPKTNTVTDPYIGQPFEILIKTLFNQDNITEWLNRIQPKVEDNTAHLYIYSGNASSPNSGASSTKILEDTAGVIKDSRLFKALLQISKHFPGHEQYHYLIQTLAENVRIDKEFMINKIHSRLFHFTAPGGKARIIANVDWLTQSALSAIHFILFSVLSKLPSDFTFNHKAGLDHINITKNSNYYSIDLSAATDRMPRILQAEVLKGLMTKLGYDGNHIAEQWLIIVDRVFKNSINDGQDLRYEVGQGMGIYTSWSVMALTHHFIINQLCNVDMDNYALVGDDLLFKGTREQYLRYLEINRIMGMSVNEGKTLQCENSDHPTMEFARNFMIRGKKLSPIQHGLLFAWNDRKVSFETFLWSLRDNIDVTILINITKQLRGEFEPRDYLFFIYFLFKSGICNIFEHRKEFESIMVLPKWADADKFKCVMEVLTTQKLPYFNRAFKGDFMDTFKSQCVVRKADELLKNAELAAAIYTLSFIDEQLEMMSSIIFNRLNSTQIISYDADESGCPLLSRSERRLLEEIDDLEKE